MTDSEVPQGNQPFTEQDGKNMAKKLDDMALAGLSGGSQNPIDTLLQNYVDAVKAVEADDTSYRHMPQWLSAKAAINTHILAEVLDLIDELEAENPAHWRKDLDAVREAAIARFKGGE